MTSSMTSVEHQDQTESNNLTAALQSPRNCQAIKEDLPKLQRDGVYQPLFQAHHSCPKTGYDLDHPGAAQFISRHDLIKAYWQVTLKELCIFAHDSYSEAV